MFMRTERMAWVAQELLMTCLAKKILSNQISSKLFICSTLEQEDESEEVYRKED